MIDYQKLLRQHDDPVRWDRPIDFDYNRASTKFSSFLLDLADCLGDTPPADTDSLVQDASFHSQTFLIWNDGQQSLVRFSSFADMVTISDPDLVPQPLMHTLLQLFLKHGYTYIPENELNRHYDGNNPGVTGIQTWWIRYFDWV